MAGFKPEGLFPEMPGQRVAASEIGIADSEAAMVYALRRERIAHAQGQAALFDIGPSGEVLITEELL